MSWTLLALMLVSGVSIALGSGGSAPAQTPSQLSAVRLAETDAGRCFVGADELTVRSERDELVVLAPGDGRLTCAKPDKTSVVDFQNAEIRVVAAQGKPSRLEVTADRIDIR